MRFRRHRGSGFSLGDVFGIIKGVPGQFGLGTLRQRFPGWIGPVGSKRRSRVFFGATLLSAFVVGYIVAITALFPAPIFPRSQDVPRLLGMPVAEAVEVLERIGLAVADTEYVSHPEIPSGSVAWQDPPPAVAVSEGTRVEISVSRGPRPIQVPDVTGYQRDVAINLIQAAGLTLARVDTGVAPAPRGVVVSSSPPAGRSLNPGSGVGIFVSVGTPTIRIPDVIGLTEDEAREMLEEAGLVLGRVLRRTTGAHEPDLIFEQTPAAGTLSAPGAVVRVTVARGGP